MITINVINVSMGEFDSKLGAFRDHRAKLQSFIEKWEAMIDAITTVAWLSPASAALLVKFRTLIAAVKVSLQIVDKFIQDLEEAKRLFTAVDNRAEQTANSLTTSAFGS
ncbi:MAG: hypothetical protein FWD38_05610 [Oscillospiraceae bacterium]|nr:hypothetical protein [Oscillospiraceae bacterium]